VYRRQGTTAGVVAREGKGRATWVLDSAGALPGNRRTGVLRSPPPTRLSGRPAGTIQDPVRVGLGPGLPPWIKSAPIYLT